MNHNMLPIDLQGLHKAVDDAANWLNNIVMTAFVEWSTAVLEFGSGSGSGQNSALNDLYMQNLFSTTYNCSINGMCHIVRDR